MFLRLLVVNVTVSGLNIIFSSNDNCMRCLIFKYYIYSYKLYTGFKWFFNNKKQNFHLLRWFEVFSNADIVFTRTLLTRGFNRGRQHRYKNKCIWKTKMCQKWHESHVTGPLALCSNPKHMKQEVKQNRSWVSKDVNLRPLSP